MGDVLEADHSGLEDARARMAHTAGELAACAGPLSRAHGSVLAGAGEFSRELEPGADRMALVGAEALAIYERAAALIAGNIGRANVDLMAVDVDTTIRL